MEVTVGDPMPMKVFEAFSNSSNLHRLGFLNAAVYRVHDSPYPHMAPVQP